MINTINFLIKIKLVKYLRMKICFNIYKIKKINDFKYYLKSTFLKIYKLKA